VITSALVLRTAVALAFAAATGAVAHANPAGVVPSAGHPGIGEAVHIEANYELDIDTAELTRERVGTPGTDPLGPLPVVRDLQSRHVRHLVTPKAELAVYHDLWLSFAVPIVLADIREIDLANGVDRNASTTIADQILPVAGFDARAPTTPLSGNAVFRSIQRAGVLELRGGLGYAPMNQALDDTKPTWKLGAEARFSIGPEMKFDAVAPGNQTGVATGVHELRLWTSVDRRTRYFEGWFEAFYQLPLYARETSLFQDPGFGATNIYPGHIAGASFGLETYLVNNPTGNRVSLDLGARLEAHFEGRGYTELWEVFALAGDSGGGGPLVLDGDPTATGFQAVSHPGVSNYEGYLETAGRVAVRAKLGSHVTFAAVGELIWKTEHVISFADAGIDLPTCPTGAPRCELDDNDAIDPGTQEVNPLHQSLIDLVGHRYHALDSLGIVLGVEAQLVF
jgi:hypothetical protein